MPSHGCWCRWLGGGYHAGERGQGFGKGPEALRAGWQGRRPASRSLSVWELRSKAKEQVLVEELQGEPSGHAELNGVRITASPYSFFFFGNIKHDLDLAILLSWNTFFFFYQSANSKDHPVHWWQILFLHRLFDVLPLTSCEFGSSLLFLLLLQCQTSCLLFADDDHDGHHWRHRGWNNILWVSLLNLMAAAV